MIKEVIVIMKPVTHSSELVTIKHLCQTRPEVSDGVLGVKDIRDDCYFYTIANLYSFSIKRVE